MTGPTSDNIIEIAIGRLGADASPRIQEILTRLIRHVHAFVLEADSEGVVRGYTVSDGPWAYVYGKAPGIHLALRYLGGES